ncbi:unnamed protein product [Caenorhabditis nigoni]
MLIAIVALYCAIKNDLLLAPRPPMGLTQAKEARDYDVTETISADHYPENRKFSSNVESTKTVGTPQCCFRRASISDSISINR